MYVCMKYNASRLFSLYQLLGSDLTQRDLVVVPACRQHFVTRREATGAYGAATRVTHRCYGLTSGCVPHDALAIGRA